MAVGMLPPPREQPVRVLHAASVPVYITGLGEVTANGRTILSVHVRRWGSLRMYVLPDGFSIDPSDLCEYQGGPE